MSIEYCAGLFDGEGNISLHRQFTYKNRRETTYAKVPNYRYRVNISLNQTRIEAIIFLYETFGGTLLFKKRNQGPNPEKTYSGRWWWEMGDAEAVERLKIMLPFLRIKTAEAELAIQFQATKFSPEQLAGGRSRKRGRTPEELEFQAWCFEEMKRLKHLHDTPALREHYITLDQQLRQLRHPGRNAHAA